MAAATRFKNQVYLLGSSASELIGAKLPSIGMTLGLFLHHHLDLKKSIRESSAAVVSEVAKVWDKARIPISIRQNCQTKVEKLFEKWRLLKKNKGRQSVTQQANESDFIATFDDLFDFAHAEALTTMTIDNDKQFLLLQRQKGRPGTVSGVDNVLFGKEQRRKHRKQQTLSRQLRIEEEQSRHSARVVELESFASSSAEDDVDESLILVVFLRAQFRHSREREVEELLSHHNWLQHWTELRYQIVKQPSLLLKLFRALVKILTIML